MKALFVLWYWKVDGGCDHIQIQYSTDEWIYSVDRIRKIMMM